MEVFQLQLSLLLEIIGWISALDFVRFHPAASKIASVYRNCYVSDFLVPKRNLKHNSFFLPFIHGTSENKIYINSISVTNEITSNTQDNQDNHENSDLFRSLTKLESLTLFYPYIPPSVWRNSSRLRSISISCSLLQQMLTESCRFDSLKTFSIAGVT